MRKVVAYELLSLDGVAEAPDQFFTDWDEAMDANLAAVIGTQDAVILGRASYEEWADFWPSSDIQPFSAFINTVEKYVATSAPLARDWPATVIQGDVADFLRELKSGPGGDIGVHASIELVRALLATDLIDEIRAVIAPVIVCSGRRPFDGVPALRLELIRSRTTPTGALLADYRVRR